MPFGAGRTAAVNASLPRSRRRGDVVRDVWLFAHKFAHVVLHHAICIGDALMLPAMLQP